MLYPSVTGSYVWVGSVVIDLSVLCMLLGRWSLELRNLNLSLESNHYQCRQLIQIQVMGWSHHRVGRLSSKNNRNRHHWLWDNFMGLHQFLYMLQRDHHHYHQTTNIFLLSFSFSLEKDRSSDGRIRLETESRSLYRSPNISTIGLSNTYCVLHWDKT